MVWTVYTLGQARRIHSKVVRLCRSRVVRLCRIKWYGSAASSGTALPHQVVRLCRIKWYGSVAPEWYGSAASSGTALPHQVVRLCRIKWYGSVAPEWYGSEWYGDCLFSNILKWRGQASAFSKVVRRSCRTGYAAPALGD